MPAPPRCFYKGARAMTFLETFPPTALRERLLVVLETQRLVLRAPRLEDAKAVAALANDRRIAENTARIPHPYKLMDAKNFIAAANTVDKEAVFLIRSRAHKGAVIGACGVAFTGDAPELGYWLGVDYWGM